MAYNVDRPQPRTHLAKLVAPNNIDKLVKAALADQPALSVERQEERLASLSERMDVIKADLEWVKAAARDGGRPPPKPSKRRDPIAEYRHTAATLSDPVLAKAYRDRADELERAAQGEPSNGNGPTPRWRRP